MKIAHVAPEFYPAIGGVGQVVRELAKRQARAGHEVHVFAPAWDKKGRIPPRDENIEGIHLHRCVYWFRAANFMTFWPSFFLKILKEDFDVIHSHLFAHPHFVLSALCAKLKGIPHIHTTHCPWSDAPRSLVGRFGVIMSYNVFSRLALKLTDKIIAITPWENEMIKRYGGDKSKIVNIPNGMSEMFFKRVNKNDFKKRLGIKDDLVLFFGRLNITKSPEDFVKIAKEVLKKRPKTTFVIRGPDEGMKKEVKKLIGSEKKIILLEETRDRNEIVKMYQDSQIYVLPSYREGLPLTIFEAMASGLPIIATPVNGIPYEIRQPDNGFLIQHGDINGFANKIIELLDNKKLLKKISESNIKKSKKYDWDLINKETLNLYSIKK